MSQSTELPSQVSSGAERTSTAGRTGGAGASRERGASGVRLKVNEIFYSLQGESSQVGRPCVLVRLTGCQMRCRWCDSEYAFYEGDWRSLESIEAELADLGCSLVEITGGEPLLQKGSRVLMQRLCEAGYEVMLETGGGVSIADIDPRVRRIVDVKCPGSGESENNHLENMALLTPRDEVKFVIADRVDYDFACEIVDAHGLANLCPVHFSPVDGELDARELAQWILDDGRDVRLGGQLHKRLWGDARGV